MKNGVVGADHEFHDKEFALGWAERFVPTPERLRLFNIILSELRELVPENGRVLELGIGPGYLANYLLDSLPTIEYLGIDFSRPMLEIAGNRLEHHRSRISYIQADLVKDSWQDSFPVPVDAIVSTWALHDLGSPQIIKSVYAGSARILGNNGILLNGDFIKPEGATQEFEAGRFGIDIHLEMLRNSGFSSAECLALLEEEIELPTPAQNYACIKAVK
ncbi:MAG TPA: class I SAM-dependent methyltransferase [Gammaproteobacteria bacterium]